MFLGRGRRAEAALGMPVAEAVVNARSLADFEGFKGCHPEKDLVIVPLTTLAATDPSTAPKNTCSKHLCQLSQKLSSFPHHFLAAGLPSKCPLLALYCHMSKLISPLKLASMGLPICNKSSADLLRDDGYCRT